MKRQAMVMVLAMLLVSAPLGAAGAAAAAEAMRTPVIPLPARVVPGHGSFALEAGMRVATSGGDEAKRIARDLSARIEASRGIPLPVDADTNADGKAAIVLVLDPKTRLPGDEAYTLEVGHRQVRITARAPAGLFYGAVTFWQLATADGKQGAATIAAQRIEDAPRFAWRGLMLDVARHFRSVDEVKALIDQMALHKLNTLHWHLTDDQGWRIQIKRYPRLAGIGGCRVPAGAAGRNDDGTPRPYCGFYTQEQIRDVVAYAAARYVTVVPEIDLPGHAQAAIAAYPQLGVTGKTPPVSPDWGVHTWLFNVDEETFTFLENVLDEVVALFPSRYVHLGGDEAAKDQWQQSASVQARMKTLGLADEMQLQGWFMERLARHLRARGRRMIGWDEILEGTPSRDATVMSWRGAQGTVIAARAGHDVVASPAPDLYFDHVQSDRADETPGRLGVTDLRSVYRFEPMPDALTAAERAHVLGAQANLWTEHLRTNERLQRAAFPRAAALAEVTWTPAGRRDWDSFLQRLVPMRARWQAADFHAADSAFAVRMDVAPVAGVASVSLSNQTGFGTIRYTTDGSAPTPASPAYRDPLRLAVTGRTLIANAFADDRALAAPRALRLDPYAVRARDSQALRPCKVGLMLRLEDDAPRDGPRAVTNVDLFDPCWIYAQAGLEGVGRVSVRTARLPFNFQLWRDASQVVTRPASQPGGALEIRLDGCDGRLLAALPLAPARPRDGASVLEAPIEPVGGAHDLCFVFASGAADPLWAIDEVTLLP